MNKYPLYSLVLLFVFFGCKQKYEKGSFGNDLEILQKVEDIEVLKNGKSMLAVSGAYQGRVFVSTSKGYEGRSCGWFNRKLVEEGNSQTQLNRLGGEGRVWFGPEIGKYSTFFDPGAAQIVRNIKISPALSTFIFSPIERSTRSITSGGEMEIRNAFGYTFKIDVKRKVVLKTQAEICADLGIDLSADVSQVAFSTETWISNTGDETWRKESGLLSIWDIGCMLPAKDNVVLIPLQKNADAVTTYFTQIDSTRIRIKNGVVYYKGDAAYMNKIGIQPEWCKPVFGSYSAELKLLNIVSYNLVDSGIYVNSLWGHEDPYKGDVINVFNGEVNAELDRNWPFYECESSSAVSELAVGETQYHKQSIYHFEGDEKMLDAIAQKVLGVSLADVANAF